MNKDDYRMPIITDNKNYRTNNKDIGKHFDESEKEMKNFPLENGIIVDPNYVDMISCPVCGNSKTKQWIVKWGGRYDICEDCNHIFIKNRFKINILNDLYKSSIADEFSRAIRAHQSSKDYWDRVYSKYIEIIVKLTGNNKNISILDIGCGAGHFCKKVKDEGINIFAADVYEDVVDVLAPIVGEKNVEFIPSIEKISIKKHDVVTLWGVLEHLPNGDDAFSTAKKICAKDGLFLILIPNIHSRAFRFLGVDIPTLNPRQHINFYSDKSIEILASKHGFSLVEKPFAELPIIDLMYDFIDDSDDKLIQDIVEKDESYYKVYIFRSTE